MGIFLNKALDKNSNATQMMSPVASNVSDNNSLAFLALNSIQEGVAIVSDTGTIKMINPAGSKMTGNIDETALLGLDIGLVLQLENSLGEAIVPAQNPMIHALKTKQALKTRDLVLAPKNSIKKVPIELSVILTDSLEGDKIVTFRDISQEKEEESAQSEFISTASHEMRTPVASIEGYLGLSLNPQTATIDERERKYLESAKTSSEHLGRLFRDLLDVTKLEDAKAKLHSMPVILFDEIKKITNDYAGKFQEKGLKFIVGDDNTGLRTLSQTIYSSVDVDFLREILSNLLENALKYCPAGGTVSVKLNGEPERGIISVSDTGIGIPNEDLQHIFQKFYRVDDRTTREIGGTGLGLYIVKKRTEAMGGTVWAESFFGKGSTFFVALPRISADEYNKRLIAYQNQLNAAELQRKQQLEHVMKMAQMKPAAGNVAQATPAKPVAPMGNVAQVTPAKPVAPMGNVTQVGQEISKKIPPSGQNITTA